MIPSIWKDYIRLRVCILLVGCCISFSVVSQRQLGFAMDPDVKRVSIPFEEYSNLIVIPLTINRLISVKFILDTGAESTILTEKLFADILKLQYSRDILISGPGIIDSLKAHIATDVSLSILGGIKGAGINLLVLEEDYLQLSENLGAEVYGIIGYDLFSRFVISINYDTKTVVFERPETFRAPKKYHQIPIELNGPKPYIKCSIEQGGDVDTLKLMVDSGASHALLLDSEEVPHLDQPTDILEARLGQGLGGEIPGYIARLDNFNFYKFPFNDVLVSFPESGAYASAIKRGSRHGTVGGDLLSRFKVIFNYNDQKIYLRKGSDFRRKFEFDMSGLTVLSTGPNLKQLTIKSVRKNSPAAEAGLLPGDEIIKINNYNLYNANLSKINYLLRKGDHYKISIHILREGKRIKKKFFLKKMI